MFSFFVFTTKKPHRSTYLCTPSGYHRKTAVLLVRFFRSEQFFLSLKNLFVYLITNVLVDNGFVVPFSITTPSLSPLPIYFLVPFRVISYTFLSL